jgi:hypothetical protein
LEKLVKSDFQEEAYDFPENFPSPPILTPPPTTVGERDNFGIENYQKKTP